MVVMAPGGDAMCHDGGGGVVVIDDDDDDDDDDVETNR